MVIGHPKYCMYWIPFVSYLRIITHIDGVIKFLFGIELSAYVVTMVTCV